MRYIEFTNKRETSSLVISVEDEDFALAYERAKALYQRWYENPIELVNNHSPEIRTRGICFELLVDCYIAKDGLIKGKEIEVSYPDYNQYNGNISVQFPLKYFKGE